MDYQIIPMDKSHVPAIAQMERDCFSDPWSENSVASELQNEYSLWLVAMHNDTLLGYVGSQIAADEADMMNLAVSKSARRQGIARSLVTSLQAALENKGVRALLLEVRASNEPAKALYASLGFEQIGLRKNYYFHPTEDAIILKKEWTL